MGKIHKNGFSSTNHPIWNILKLNVQDICQTLLRIQHANFNPEKVASEKIR